MQKQTCQKRIYFLLRLHNVWHSCLPEETCCQTTDTTILQIAFTAALLLGQQPPHADSASQPSSTTDGQRMSCLEVRGLFNDIGFGAKSHRQICCANDIADTSVAYRSGESPKSLP